VTNESTAIKTAERLHHLVNLPSDLAEVERLRLIGVGIHRQIAETDEQLHVLATTRTELEQAQLANSEALLSAIQRVDDVLGALYRPAEVVVENVVKVTRTKKKEEAPAPPAQREASTPAEKHPCHLCEDVFYHKVDLVKHLRLSHKLSMEESVKPVETIEDHGFNTDARRAQLVAEKADRDSKCDKWLDCEHAKACFDPDKAALQGTYCMPKTALSLNIHICDYCRAAHPGCTDCCDTCNTACNSIQGCRMAEMREQYEATAEPRIPIEDFIQEYKVNHGLTYQIVKGGASSPSAPCWNSSCAWADLAQPDHCDADGQFRAGRPVAECKCFVNGIGPTKGQDAAACFNTNCPSNDPTLPTCCEEWEEVWECPEVVTAGWGAAKEADVLSGNDDAALTDDLTLSRHEPAEAILPRGEFKAADVPKGKKKQLAMLEALRADVAKLVARRIDLFKRGSAAVSDYDKGMGYDLDYNLTQNKIQLGYALSQFNGLNELLNPSAPAPAREVEKQEAAQPVDESPAQASEIVRCDNPACEYSDPSALDGCFVPAEERHGKPLNKCPNFKETPDETATQETGPESDETEQSGAADAVPASEPVAFAPLDAPLGDCELCHGYGVIDGELYGEFALVPCTCEAGEKVAGHAPEEPLLKCCQDCSIKDPACADCHLPDMESPFEVEGEPVTYPPLTAERASADVNAMLKLAEIPKCANGPCTATGKKPKDICLRVQGKECKNFVPLEKCTHHMMKRSTVDGATVCDLCGFVLHEAPKVEPVKCGNKHCSTYDASKNSNCGAIEDLLKTSGEQRMASGCKEYKPVNLANAEPVKPTLTPMQQKCTHPKVFREQTEAGEVCKVCKLVLSGGGNRDSFRLEAEVWDGVRH